MSANITRIELTRSIILGGEDAERGEVYEVSRLLAYDLIAQGSAILHLEDGEKPESPPTPEEIFRQQQAMTAEPKPRRVVGAKPNAPALRLFAYLTSE